MFKKVLKYDFYSIYNIWWIIAIGMLSASLIGSFSLRFYISNWDSDGATGFIAILALITTIITIFAIIASFALTPLLAHYQFYKNFYTDEGYLTFTLPVKRRTLLLSKIANSFIWESINGAIFLACVLIFFIFSPPAAGGPVINTVVFRGIGNIISGIWDMVGAWLILYIFESVIAAVILTLFSIILIENCITVGAVMAKKNKLLVGIGIYYLTTSVLSFAAQLLMTVGASIITPVLTNLMTRSVNAGCAVIAAIILILTLVIAGITFGGFVFMQRKIERSLNLA